ncbi:hypothetical protein CI424_25300 [Salmonella enterica subsp. enterica serovar Enteritidis]|nr:hypothetical protein [Salmonella enterica subsp. enterica]ECI2267545.1 hypothetical protein [Salmonella enterica subsp. enterica serovar Wandsworth]EDK5264450.1 hypothetical protein [Salmonella enterica subsp. enterica serovar Enteritidis]EDU1385214.1 autotransporter outer membrane beta-barrel domain-containing protein [Salmonella enterica subsp. enterica serovar 4,[5],12:b:-]
MSEGYADNNRFSVRDMVNNYGNGAQVTGKIDSVSTPLPMLIASYGYQNPDGSGDWENQWVSLNIDAGKSEGSAMSDGVTGNMQNQAERLGHILLDEPRGQGINNDEINMKVYYGHLKRRGMGAADTDSIGTVGYADYILSSDIMVGWHGGIEYVWLKAKSKTLQMNSTSGIMGLHGRYNITDRMYFRSQLSGILSRDHNYFSSFDGSHAKASVTNSGFYGASYLGYDFILNGKHVI